MTDFVFSNKKEESKNYVTYNVSQRFSEEKVLFNLSRRLCESKAQHPITIVAGYDHSRNLGKYQWQPVCETMLLPHAYSHTYTCTGVRPGFKYKRSFDIG